MYAPLTPPKGGVVETTVGRCLIVGSVSVPLRNFHAFVAKE